MLRPRALFLLVGWTVPALLAGGCGSGAKAGTDPKLSGVKPREAARVMLAPVEKREMLRRLETTTRIESKSQVSLNPRAIGVVVEVLAEEGDRVHVGQVLARLDDREKRIAAADARAALESATADLPKLKLATQESESRMESARLAFEQASRDHERNLAIAASDETDMALISKRDLDASALARDQRQGEHQAAQLALERAKIEVQGGEAALERAKLSLERANIELSFTEITSPIDGVIAERGLRVGDTVSASTVAFVITDPSDLRAIFFRPQRELSLFQRSAANDALDAPRPGEAVASGADIEVGVRAEALPGHEFRGWIERISPTIDAASGNFRVTARLEPQAIDDDRARLLPGMLVRLEIVTERHPGALAVPKRAIRREGDRSVVFAVRDGVAHSEAVLEGLTDDDDVEVSPLAGANLAAGDLVVVVGNRDLEDGSAVRADETTRGADGAAQPTSADESTNASNSAEAGASGN